MSAVPQVESTERATQTTRSAGGVQSLGRAFTILECIADAGGVVSLSELAGSTGLPLPTIHRMVRTLVDLGYVRQEASRRYALGPRLIRLGEVTERRIPSWSVPHMEPVVKELGESVNLATLDGDKIVYISNVMPSQNSMRMFTEVGRRVDAHATAVGKAILAREPEDEVRALLVRSRLAAHTEHTIDSEEEFMTELAQARVTGYAVDNEEQEIGVRCVAVAVPADGHRMAVSVSGPLSRMNDAAVSAAVLPLQRAAAAIAAELDVR
ncbi:allantoin degradation transcriptional regulator AllR [soil metagenome]